MHARSVPLMVAGATMLAGLGAAAPASAAAARPAAGPAAAASRPPAPARVATLRLLALARARAGLAARGISVTGQPAGSAITGIVRRPAAGLTGAGTGVAALPGACVTAAGPAGSAIATAGRDGRFTLTGLRPGRYTLRYRDCAAPGHYFDQWSGGSAWQSLAVPVSVGSGQVRSVGPVTLRPATSGQPLAGRPRFSAAPAGMTGAGKTGSVSGTVTGNGRPVDALCVAAQQAGGGFGFSGQTAKNGRYTVGHLPPGRYLVQFGETFCGRNPGNWLTQWYRGITSAFGSPKARQVVVRAGRTTRGIDAALVRGGQISGTVTTSSGRKLGGICVTINGRVPHGFIGLEFPTGRDGGYVAHGLFAGGYVVGFSSGCGDKGDYAPQWWRRSATLRGAAALKITGHRVITHVSAALGPGGDISGTVRATNAAGMPLAGICVQASSADGAIGVAAATGKDGSYQIRDLGTGRYQLQFQPGCGGGNANYLPQSKLVAVTAGRATAGVNAYLRPGAGVSGVVTDGHHRPIAGICVSIQNSNSATGLATGPGGSYSVTGLPPGRYTVAFAGGCGNAGSYAPQWYDGQPNGFAPTPVTLTAGTTTSRISAVMRPGATISGAVTDRSGRRLSGVCVGILSPPLIFFGPGVFNAITYAVNGRYVAANLAPGGYLLDFGCGHGQYADQWFRSRPDLGSADLISAAAGVVTRVSAVLQPAGSLSGVATDHAGHRLSGICVLAVPERSPYPPAIGGPGQPMTSNGTYRISGLAAGRYAVQFYDCSSRGLLASQWFRNKPSQAAADPVPVSAGRTTTGVGAVMTTGGSVSGQVTDRRGKPLKGACVFAFDAVTQSLGFAFTSSSGAYRIPGLSSGRYLLQFSICLSSRPDLASVTRMVRVTAPRAITGVNGRLVAAGSVTGTILAGSPHATPQAGVCVAAVPVNPLGSYGSAVTRTDGSYQLSGLATGSYQLYIADPACPFGNTAFAPQWYDNQPTQRTATTVAVTAGQVTAGIGATLRSYGAISGTVTGPSAAGVGGECVQAVPIGAVPDPIFGLAQPAEIAISGPRGRYALSGLPPGRYKVEFTTGCGATGYRSQWWNEEPSRQQAAVITVAAAVTITAIDAKLQR